MKEYDKKLGKYSELIGTQTISISVADVLKADECWRRKKTAIQSREKIANSGRTKITKFNRAGNSTVSRDSQGTAYASPMAALTALRPSALE